MFIVDALFPSDLWFVTVVDVIVPFIYQSGRIFKISENVRDFGLLFVEK